VLITAREEIQKYKKDYEKADQIYKLECDAPVPEDKLLLSKLLKQNTVDRTERKSTINDIKMKLKKFRVRFETDFFIDR
jgi:hypothetical protein